MPSAFVPTILSALARAHLNASDLAISKFVMSRFRISQIAHFLNLSIEMIDAEALDPLRAIYLPLTGRPNPALDDAALVQLQAFQCSQEPTDLPTHPIYLMDRSITCPVTIYAREHISAADDIDIITCSIHPTEISRSYFPSDLTGTPDATTHATRVLRALDSIRQVYPCLAEYVEAATRVLVILKSQKGLSNSGSSPLHPHMIYCSETDDLSQLIEVLIHEASHQYLAYAECLFQFYKSSELLYFNPILNRDRPIWGIMAAYHAFGMISQMMPGIIRSLSLPAAQVRALEEKYDRMRAGARVISQHVENSDELSLEAKDFYCYLGYDLTTYERCY